MEAPWVSNNFIGRMWARCAARERAVSPNLLVALISAPREMSSSPIFRFPSSAASMSKVQASVSKVLMRLSFAAAVFSCYAALMYLTGCRANHGRDQVVIGTQAVGAALHLSLCDILNNPTAFSGSPIVVRVRIYADKENTYIWEPTCKGRGISMQVDPSAESDPGVTKLIRLVHTYPNFGHPVIATLTGTFLYDHYDEIRQERRSILSVTAASDMSRSPNVERP